MEAYDFLLVQGKMGAIDHQGADLCNETNTRQVPCVEIVECNVRNEPLVSSDFTQTERLSMHCTAVCGYPKMSKASIRLSELV